MVLMTLKIAREKINKFSMQNNLLLDVSLHKLFILLLSILFYYYCLVKHCLLK